MNLKAEIDKLKKIAIGKVIPELPVIEICGVCPTTKEITFTFIMGEESKSTGVCEDCTELCDFTFKQGNKTGD